MEMKMIRIEKKIWKIANVLFNSENISWKNVLIFS
jgi:hypothetical protein